MLKGKSCSEEGGCKFFGFILIFRVNCYVPGLEGRRAGQTETPEHSEWITFTPFSLTPSSWWPSSLSCPHLVKKNKMHEYMNTCYSWKETTGNNNSIDLFQKLVIMAIIRGNFSGKEKSFVSRLIIFERAWFWEKERTWNKHLESLVQVDGDHHHLLYSLLCIQVVFLPGPHLKMLCSSWWGEEGRNQVYSCKSY